MYESRWHDSWTDWNSKRPPACGQRACRKAWCWKTAKYRQCAVQSFPALGARATAPVLKVDLDVDVEPLPLGMENWSLPPSMAGGRARVGKIDFRHGTPESKTLDTAIGQPRIGYQTK